MRRISMNNTRFNQYTMPKCSQPFDLYDVKPINNCVNSLDFTSRKTTLHHLIKILVRTNTSMIFVAVRCDHNLESETRATEQSSGLLCTIRRQPIP